MLPVPPGRTVWAGTWVLLLALAFTAGAARAAPQFPELTGRVVDKAGILKTSVEGSLTQKLKAHEDQTSNQVVVVTLASLEGYAIEDYGYQLGRHWGIGQAERNNGVLLIVAPNERKVRIEVGYGLEGALTDALAKIIIEREITPAFRKGDFDKGVAGGVEAILAAVAGEYEAEPHSKDGLGAGALLFIMFILLIGLPALIIMFAAGEMKTNPSRATTRRRRSSDDDDDYTSGGYFGGGGFGGGGGGFSGGGGGFGGGGSSGSW